MNNVWALHDAIGERRMLRSLAMFAAFSWLQISHAQTFTEYESANGIKYSIPDSWTPITLNQVVRYGTQVPDYIGRLEQEVPGAQRLHSESGHIFFFELVGPRQTTSCDAFPYHRPR
jgi:hypothetical protein